ncbi:F0F1 ATP synthase subunit delta [Candidatus Saccharibacteria bacterium oral taxon 488]|nr:F0F1 ATP synthase subunit delta [Candidatus Saccharibacteria bacterium oral taxon 488]
MARTLRRKLARHAAERLLAGDAAVIDELAALIVHERREREVDLLVQDIEAELAERGTVVATVESATSLDEATKGAIRKLLSSDSGMESLSSVEGRSAARASRKDARSEARVPETDGSDRATQHVELPDTEVPSDRIVQVRLREIIRSELIGGVKITTPTQVMDATIAKKLNDLRAKKI